MSKIYFTSDLHFGHENVIRFDDRPFASAEQLNAEGIRNEIYNVGCMYWNYEPVTLDEIIRHGRTIRPNYGERSDEVRENNNE